MERIVTALAVPRDVAAELLALARMANVDYVSYRTYASIGLWKVQADIKSLAESSSVVRQFLPAMPGGLVQTPEYARLALTPNVPSRPARDVEKAVRARLDRQQVLDDTSKTFIILMTEQAVRWRYCDRGVMARQVEHMVRVASRPNVEIAILPLAAQVAS